MRKENGTMQNFNDFLIENYGINVDQFEIERDDTKRIIYSEYAEYVKTMIGSENYNPYENIHDSIRLNNARLRIE